MASATSGFASSTPAAIIAPGESGRGWRLGSIADLQVRAVSGITRTPRVELPKRHPDQTISALNHLHASHRAAWQAGADVRTLRPAGRAHAAHRPPGGPCPAAGGGVAAVVGPVARRPAAVGAGGGG